MKNRIKLFFVALVLGISMSAKASDGWAVTVDAKQNLVVEIKKNLQKATLTLQDQDGNIYFKDGLMDKESYTKSMNMEGLPDGTYYVKFENEYNIFTEVVTKAGNSIEVKKDTDEVIFKPSFKTEGKVVKFLFTNPKEEQTEVKVLDASGELVGMLSARSTVVQRSFDFSNVPSGTYRIKVDSGAKHFTQEVKIN